MTERGFTVLEVMLALAILAIALPVLLGLRNRDVELLGYAQRLTTATLLAQEKLLEADLMAFPPTGEQSGDFQHPSPGTMTSEPAQDRPRDFRWTRTVVQTPLDPVREVRIKITWPRGGTEETLEVTSYVFLEPPTSS